MPIPPRAIRQAHCSTVIELMLNTILLSESKVLKTRARTTPPRPLKKTITDDETFSHLAMITLPKAPVTAVPTAKRAPKKYSSPEALKNY